MTIPYVILFAIIFGLFLAGYRFIAWAMDHNEKKSIKMTEEEKEFDSTW